MLEWNDFILGDSFNLMQEIEPNSVDLIFTSVPDMNDLGIKDITEYEDFISLAMVKFEHLISDTGFVAMCQTCLLYTSPSPRDATLSRMPSSA